MAENKIQDRLELIGKISSRLGSGGSFLDQLQYLMSEVCEVLGTDACVIRELEGDRLKILSMYGVNEKFVPPFYPANKGLAEKLLTTKKPVTVLRADHNPITKDIHEVTAQDKNHFTFISYAGAPMITNGDVIGVFGVYMTTREHKFPKEDLELLQIIANAAGQSLLNDELFRRFKAAKPILRQKIIEILREESDTYPEQSAINSEFDMEEEEITARNQIEIEMQDDKIDLLLHYQPLQQPHTKDIVGYEALLRWNHPRLGLVGPSVFISVAESTGIIRKLGYKIYDLVSKDLKLLTENDNNPLKFISVNFSINELSIDGFPQQLAKFFNEEDIASKKIVIEITERIALERYSTAGRNLLELHEMGFPIFIDDFGAGQTSFSQIINFPINGIKIDRTFMPKSWDDKKRLIVFKNMAQMAHDLGIIVVAEGIENFDQEEIARDLGIDLIQGFRVAEPKPLAIRA